jgi:hypothetical protein
VASSVLSTLAIVPRNAEIKLVPLCEELSPDTRKKRHLERKLDRQRRANNPQNYDAKRWHQCACGVGPVQRELYSAFLAAYLDPPDYLPSQQELVYRRGRLEALQ